MPRPRPPACAMALVVLAILLATAAASAAASAPARLSDLAGEQQPVQRLRRPTDKEPPVWPEQLHAGETDDQGSENGRMQCTRWVCEWVDQPSD